MPKTGINLEKYLRRDIMPSPWCPGCGHGNILRGILESFDRLKLDLDKVVVVGGIGCSGRTPYFTNTNSMHTTHGRALAFSTGVKMTNPELTVLTVMGDGDSVGIGGNHFIHACRRNIDLNAIIFNNSIYGMTGGQTAPTTPTGKKSTTSFAGSIEAPFDIVELALAAGATFVARTTTFDFQDMPDLITRAIEHPGFSVVEILSQCPTYFGRINKLGDATEMLDYEKDLTIPGELISREEMIGEMPIGVFREEIKPEFTDQYRKVYSKTEDVNAS
ncbi:MAG TPA: 2-oxoacid:ferredoxin oxidoreductase subunit beta [Balneolaceae bacterium]|nr:2-oxoacid:ferredoxin oxidoreductase subunit beta [Balneolaceae bacterium]